jgi:hypothetical protein
MDPITLLAAASAVWNGIKKASEFAQEAEGVWSQLSKYVGYADQLEQHIQQEEKESKKPSIFRKLTFGDDTKEAFDAYAAKVKMREMEAEIRHEFLYGGLCHLGMDGLREFYEMRRKVREQRIKAIQDQRIRQRQFVEACFTGGLIMLGSAAVISIIWMAVEVISMGAA